MGRADASFIDRALAQLAPQWQLRRDRARIARELVLRHYEGASGGRRTQGWKRSSSDAASAVSPFVGRLRDAARDLVRNNPHAESALGTIVDHVAGWSGIVAKPKRRHQRAKEFWEEWTTTTACDADGRHDFAGLQQLVIREVAEAGEVLVRRRLRRPEDGLPIPLQLQVLEADFIDTSKHGIAIRGGGRIVYGVEFNAIGQRVAYWLYPEHPGSSAWPAVASQRVPAEGVLHIFKATRAGAVRGASWFAPVLLRFKDFDEYEDATLLKQKIAACLAVITSDVDGSASALGLSDDASAPAIDTLEPGMILNVPPGRNVEVVQPPSVADYATYAQVSLRAIASGLGVTYEDLTGDYQNLPFSAARMSRLRHSLRVYSWQARMLVPQFCAPVWGWAMQAAAVMGVENPPARASWTPPPLPLVDPDKEARALVVRIRSGLCSLQEALRELGYDPEEVLSEIAETNELLDALGLKLDSDPRALTQQGQVQKSDRPATAAEDDAADDDDDDEEKDDDDAGEKGRRVAVMRRVR